MEVNKSTQALMWCNQESGGGFQEYVNLIPVQEAYLQCSLLNPRSPGWSSRSCHDPDDFSTALSFIMGQPTELCEQRIIRNIRPACGCTSLKIFIQPPSKLLPTCRKTIYQVWRLRMIHFITLRLVWFAAFTYLALGWSLCTVWYKNMQGAVTESLAELQHTASHVAILLCEGNSKR